jgi:hypothetical protein
MLVGSHNKRFVKTTGRFGAVFGQRILVAGLFTLARRQ